MGSAHTLFAPARSASLTCCRVVGPAVVTKIGVLAVISGSTRRARHRPEASPSGSAVSRMIASGCERRACWSASGPVKASRTVYPAGRSARSSSRERERHSGPWARSTRGASGGTGSGAEPGAGRCGMAVVKLAGRVQGLAQHLEREPVHGTSGIAHTRWATHGVPSERNAHPHGDCHARVALVHNGIVENADALRVALEAAGHRFITETDTETLAHLIEDAAGDTLEERVIAALAHVEGTYGLAVMSTDEPGKIVVARRGSPVLLGIGEEELFVASDASAVLEHTRSVVYLDDGDIAVLTADGYHVVDAESHVQLREVDDVAWDLAEIELGGYPHFMLKEISEQAETVRATLRGRLLQDRGTARLHGLNLTPADCRAPHCFGFLACGSSGHACR